MSFTENFNHVTKTFQGSGSCDNCIYLAQEPIYHKANGFSNICAKGGTQLHPVAPRMTLVCLRNRWFVPFNEMLAGAE